MVVLVDIVVVVIVVVVIVGKRGGVVGLGYFVGVVVCYVVL